MDLLQRMVCLSPAKRITAAQALEHRYFRSEPAPTPRERLPRPKSLAAAAERTPAAVQAQAEDALPAGLDSGDARFLKKRRMQMDAAFEAVAG